MLRLSKWPALANRALLDGLAHAVRKSTACVAGGRLELIVGPMFSGKTTELLRRVHRYRLAGRRVLLLKSIKDTRAVRADQTQTHDGKASQAVPVGQLREASALALGADVVGVDEGQFFPDLEETCSFLADRGRVVIVAALDGTFAREPFLPVVRLVAQAESVTKLTSVCSSCGAEAPFSRRRSPEREIEVIGGSDKYSAACRVCFANLTSAQPRPTGALANDL